MSQELPQFILLPLPTEIPRSYGLEATSGPYSCLIQCRGTKKERDKIQKAAALLGITYGTFMRRVVNDAADAIINQQEKK
jgi:hypothetical protein